MAHFCSTIHIFVAVICILAIIDATSGKLAKDSLNTNNPRCTQKRQNKAERAVARIIGFGKNGRSFPDSFNKVKRFCKETTRLVTQVENFIKECFRKEVSDLASVILYSVKSNMIRQYCGKTRNSKRVTNLVKVSPCINKHFLPDDHCIVQFINSSRPLMNIKEDKLKIPHTCCNYVKTIECFEKHIESERCLVENRERIMDIIKGLFSGVTDIMCGEYNESTDRCQALGEAPQPLAPNKKKYATFMFLLTDILASTTSFAF